jgi:hypothetical protein
MIKEPPYFYSYCSLASARPFGLADALSVKADVRAVRKVDDAVQLLQVRLSLFGANGQKFVFCSCGDAVELNCISFCSCGFRM